MARLSGATGAIVLTLLAGAWAQAQAPADSQSPQGRRYVVLGCVDREAAAAAGRGATPAPGAPGARFIITDQRGDKPTVYRLNGDAKELEFHVGHTVEVSGPLSAPPANATGPNARALTLTITTLAYISPACKLLK